MLKPKVFVPVVVVVLLLVSAALYGFMWRVPDSDYSAVSKNLQNLSTSVSAITDSTNAIQRSSDISDATVSTLEASLSHFTSNFDTVAKNPVATRDLTVKSVYDKNADTLNQYKQSAKQLVDSLKVYRSLLDTCTDLVDEIDQIGTTSAFDTAAKDCKSAIATAKSAPYAPFNDQFLREYTTLAESLLQAYRQFFVQADAKSNQISYDGVTAAQDKITKLGETSTLQLTLTPDPTDAIQALTKVVNSQSKSLLR